MCVNNTSEPGNIIYNILIGFFKNFNEHLKKLHLSGFHLKLFFLNLKTNNGDLNIIFLPKNLLIFRKHQPKSIIQLN